MRARAAVVVLLMVSSLAGILGANVAASSAATFAGGATQQRQSTFTFHGSVGARHRVRAFAFTVPATATVKAHLTWRNPHAKLVERLRHHSLNVRASRVSKGRKSQSRLYRRVLSDRYGLRVRLARGSSRFDVVIKVSWTVVAPPPAATPAPAWAAEFMTDGSQKPTYDPGLTMALRQATNFGMIAAHAYTYRNYVSQMKTANPNLELLVYLNGAFSSTGSPTQYPDSWYARDAQGRKILYPQYGTYLMDPLNPDWSSTVVQLCQTRLAYSGYDGCFVDSMGPSALNPTIVSGLPIDPRTGQVWTRSDWLNATTNVVSQVHAGISPRPVVANGLGFGGSYFDTSGATSQLLDGGDGSMAESFARAATSNVNTYKNDPNWVADIAMLADAAARGKIAITTTKVWTTATAQQVDRWQRFSYGTFLLGYEPGHGYYSFRSDHGLTAPSFYYDMPIGTPTGGYAEIGGVYQRAFTTGLVVVNPSTSAVTVSLGGSYTNLDGVSVTTETLEPHSADIFYH